MNPLTTGRIHTARFIVGDVFERLAELPDASVDLVLTSPPFLALRSYLPKDHPDKHQEIGSEATPAEYLDVLLQLTAEWGRVLAPHGSLCVELGDVYAGSGGAGGDYNPDEPREGQQRFDGTAARARSNGAEPRPSLSRTRAPRPGWPLDKSLTFVPSLYGACLAYGRNLLTGEPSPAGQWRIRNLVAWVRPNPPVGALGDKVRPATSYVTVATRARDRWFDLDAVRTPPKWGQKRSGDPTKPKTGGFRGVTEGGERQFNLVSDPAGAPPLDWWEIQPGGYSGAHYAVWPKELCRRLIDTMCPRRVCTSCGNPSRRVLGDASYVGSAGQPVEAGGKSWHSHGDGAHRGRTQDATGARREMTRVAPTTGWSTCGCPDTDSIRLDGYHTGTGWRPGVALDPFAGSGTTLAVASGMGRDSLGIDLDSRNADLARERVGLFLDVIESGSLFEEANDG